MNEHDAFVLNVAQWLDEEAERGALRYLDETLERTARTRQRPAWSSLERWLPVQTTLRLVPVPRAAWLLLILGLVVAIGAAVLAVGSQARRPPPFGPAGNGSIVYGTADGDIYAYDTVTGTSKPLIAGLTHDETPDFAPDGSSFVFARQTEDPSRWTLMLAAADGSNIRALTPPIDRSWNAWSGDSTRLAVVDEATAAPKLTIYRLDGTAPVDLPAAGMSIDRLSWRSSTELVFRGRNGATFGLYAISTDGTAPRALLPTTSVETDWIEPVMAPDGGRIAWTKWVEGPVIHVLDIETGLVTTPVFAGSNLGDGWPTAFSPDGTSMVFSRWDGEKNHLAVGAVSGGRAVETGPGYDDFTNGANGQFSPDGTKIIARYGFDPEATWLLDPAGGEGDRVLTGVDQLATWQRIAP
ncbi:MAG: PD40 domain-containing protein [Chloroflexi bacterium]|nr:PD40 domain-containing protein [Chloroflexota bacterium]